MRQLVLSTPHLQPKIALGMIVKNEEKVIIKTISSTIDAVDAIYLYDTGSTDNTIQLVQEYSKQYPDKKFYYKFGEFKYFDVTRNELLEWIDNHEDALDLDFILLLDANDEFHGTQELRKFAQEHLINTTEDEGGFYIEQKWFYGEVLEIYYNVFLIRPRMGWRYYGKVHEYIGPKDIHLAKPPIRCPSEIYIYQNRNENCEESFVRYRRDYKIFMEELEENPEDPRSLFYMGQTCDCLELYNEAFHYYLRRIDVKDKGLPEEVFHTYLRLGNLCVRLKKSHKDIVKYYMAAYETWNRVEPILRLCEYYLHIRKQARIAYGYACMAIFTPYPHNSLLFVNRTDYDYRRYNRFLLCAMSVGDFDRAHEIAKQMKKLDITEDIDDAIINDLEKLGYKF